MEIKYSTSNIQKVLGGSGESRMGAMGVVLPGSRQEGDTLCAKNLAVIK